MFLWRATLLTVVLGLGAAGAGYDVRELRFLNISSFDGTVLRADVSLPVARASWERFPVLILANSWACPQVEYVIQAQKFAAAGYLVLEYEARGWYASGGEIGTAGIKDQLDISEVISFVLNQTTWQPNPEKVALIGISYGAGLALLGAGRDPRVKAALSMSGWQSLERALYENSSPNLVWGEQLVLLAHFLGRPSPELDKVFHELLAGDEAAFRDWAAERSPVRYQAALEARQVPLFISNNFEDGLFKPQDALDFFQSYSGPKRLLLNQGTHATAEIGGLVDLPHNHIWVEAKKWLDTKLKGLPGPAPALVEMQLRNDRSVREQFMEWPSRRVLGSTFRPAPRGKGLFGLLRPSLPNEAEPWWGTSDPAETITFGKRTGLKAGSPTLGEVLEPFVDMKVRSNLLLSSQRHALWYYMELKQRIRFCGTPELSLDITPSQPRWQVVAYVFGVDRLTKIGTLISHGSMTCWNCTARVRQTNRIELRTLCEELGGLTMGGLGLAVNLYADLYQPANEANDLNVTFHYSNAFSFVLPAVEDSSGPGREPPLGELIV